MKKEWAFNGNEIVSVDNPRVGIGGFITSDEDNVLAAAAPELLEALEEVVEVFTLDRTEYNADQKEAVLKANAVISKAKGETDVENPSTEC